MKYREMSDRGKKRKAWGRKKQELKASVGKQLGRASQTSEHIDREASSTELTLCPVCEGLHRRTFDGQHICSDTHKEPKECLCWNKRGVNSGSMRESVLIQLCLKPLGLESNVVCVAVKRSFGSANTRGRNYRRQTPDNMKKHLREKHLLLDATRPKGDFSPPPESPVSNGNERETENENEGAKQTWENRALSQRDKERARREIKERGK